MVLTNAEKQRKFREKQKQRILKYELYFKKLHDFEMLAQELEVQRDEIFTDLFEKPVYANVKEDWKNHLVVDDDNYVKLIQ